jgi:epoxyqueuosine reductase
MNELLYSIQEHIGAVAGRAVDSTPVLDKAWAAKVALDWKEFKSDYSKVRFFLFL